MTIQAQEFTPEEFIKIHLQALGSSDVLDSAMVCETSGTLEITNLGKTQTYRFRNLAARDGRRYSERANSLGGILYRSVWNGEKAWQVKGDAIKLLEGTQRAALRNRPFISPFLDSTYYKGQLIGLKQRANKIVLTVKDPSGELHNYTFDSHTYLLREEVYRDAIGILHMLTYSDYQEMAGLQFPQQTTRTLFIDTDDGSPRQQSERWILEEVRLYKEPEEQAHVFELPY